MPNGNTIITSAAEQNVFEIDSAGNTEWSYEGNLNTARAIKYPLDYFGNTNLLGDLNNDQILNILDIIQIVNIILSNNYVSNGDFNSDDVINILDIIQLINIILD